MSKSTTLFPQVQNLRNLKDHFDYYLLQFKKKDKKDYEGLAYV